MKFYDREEELNLLETTRERSTTGSKMIFVVGRRRIGKTSLVLKAFENQKSLYFFVARKSEILLCYEYTDEIERVTGKKVIGEFTTFGRLFEYLLDYSHENPITVIIDEFQEFYQVNRSVYSDIQNLWDRYRAKSRMNLVLCGSVYSLMKKIFEDAKEPLFGRANEKISLKPFTIDIITRICTDHSPDMKASDLLAFYAITGGIAKYTELFADKECFTTEKMLNEIFRENSLLLEEGKNILIEEFGRDYLTYFSILSLIASSKTSRGEIESVLQKDIGGFLERLEKDYYVIGTVRPVFSRPGQRALKYFINDHFLAFWFRFIYKYRSAVEIGNLNYVKQIVKRDFPAYSGPYLEKLFREKLALSGQFNRIGRYWNRKGDVEIDIIAVNDDQKKALIGEVKINPGKFSPDHLKYKSQTILPELEGYTIEYKGFSVEGIRD
jgi:AAA+ ATPase superfamily predicted ATPase